MSDTPPASGHRAETGISPSDSKSGGGSPFAEDGFRQRFMWWSPLHVSSPWRPRIFRGCDEWHNRSWAVVVPFLGCFIFFVGRPFDRSGREHLWAYDSDGFEGQYVPWCDGCVGFINSVWEETHD